MTTATKIRIPSKEEFGGEDFIEAPEIEELARSLVATHYQLDHLKSMPVEFLWKARGGKRSGLATWGVTQQITGLLRHYVKNQETQFVIWLAADNCASNNFGDNELEALLFHELLHPAYDEDKDRWYLANHDFIGFVEEIRVFGAWRPVLKDVAKALKTKEDGVD